MSKDRDDRFEAFLDAMDKVRAVLDGGEKPGGRLCTFPHCTCKSPWELCEKTKVKSASKA